MSFTNILHAYFSTNLDISLHMIENQHYCRPVVWLDIATIKYVSFDSTMELWLKIMQIGCTALKAH